MSISNGETLYTCVPCPACFTSISLGSFSPALFLGGNSYIYDICLMTATFLIPVLLFLKMYLLMYFTHMDTLSSCISAQQKRALDPMGL